MDWHLGAAFEGKTLNPGVTTAPEDSYPTLGIESEKKGAAKVMVVV